MSNDVDHLLMCLCAIFMPSLVKYLFTLISGYSLAVYRSIGIPVWNNQHFWKKKIWNNSFRDTGYWAIKDHDLWRLRKKLIIGIKIALGYFFNGISVLLQIEVCVGDSLIWGNGAKCLENVRLEFTRQSTGEKRDVQREVSEIWRGCCWRIHQSTRSTCMWENSVNGEETWLKGL